jgi:outer membrane protein insertion porin family
MGVQFAHRPIADIRVEGLKQVQPTLVFNQVRCAKGDGYDPQTVREDVVRITYLGRFSNVTARVVPNADGSVDLIYVVDEQPLLQDVQFVGNKKITDNDLFEAALLRPGDPADPFLIDKATRLIRKAYEDKGYFVVDVRADKSLLDEQNILIFRIREGPRVHIRGIAFEGHAAFSQQELRSKIKSNTHIWLLRKGELSREQLDLDAARLRDFYRERGYLEAQVGRRIDLSPDQKNAVVTFVISEGPQYTVEQIHIDGNALFTTQELLSVMKLRPGEPFSADDLRRSNEAITDLYGKLGFLDTKVDIKRPVYHENQPKADVQVTIDEGEPALVGKVMVRGNQTTRDKVILRQLRGLTPGRPFDRTQVETTERRLGESSLFSEANVTILGNPGDEYRDVLVEVKEQNSGSISFGAGVSSDVGVIGAIDLVQRNFDLTDLPESWGEFFTGKAFRGAGQYFAVALQPGNEYSRYSVSFREPYLLESDYFLDLNAFFYQRERESYDEERFGGSTGIGQRFGDVWSASVNLRYENVDIDHINRAAPVDVFAVEGASTITALGFSLSRDTTDSTLFPTKGSVTALGVSRAGALGGDYEFTALTARWQKFWTVDEDFLERKTVVSFRLETGYILEDNEAPVFERFYAGGHRSIRGFRLRGAGPRGVRNDTGQLGDDPVGGDFLFLASLEYNFPIWQEIFRGVFFTDTGTVQDDVGFDEYRVSIGAGLRIKIPFLGQAPFALDFAVPLLKQDGDEERLISFDIAIPLH